MRPPLVLATSVLAVLVLTGAVSTVPRVESEQPLLRIEIATDDPVALLAHLESAGFDTMHASTTSVVGRDALMAIGSSSQVDALRAAGHEVTLIAAGRPFREIAAERGELRTTPIGGGSGGGSAGAPDGSTLPAGYVDLPTLEADLAALAAAHPTLAQVVDLNAAYGLPDTIDGNTIKALKISDAVESDEDEPAMLLVSCYHAREVITPLLALDAATRLLSGYGTDPQLTAFVDEHEIWIAPVWNPDGYTHCFNADNNWRKNRRDNGDGSFGVDLNRNHAFGWTSPCSGSTVTVSQTYKGVAASSEVETQVMEAFAADRHFAKVLDYHSYGEEVLWGYNCSLHPLVVFMQSEAAALSTASGYFGAERPPSAEGEHYQWQLASFGSHAFLTETQTQFQPTFAEALAEATLVWPGVVWLLDRAMPLSGHVTDACSGAPVVADIEIPGLGLLNGETNTSGGPFGRYHAFLPAGSYTARFSAPGYVTEDHPFDVLSTSSAVVLDVALETPTPLGCWTLLGQAKPGVAGEPVLEGTGTLLPGTLQIVRLTSAAPSTTATLVFGLTAVGLPFKGGTLVPFPSVLLPLSTDVTGAATLPFTLPVGTPPAVDLLFQAWIDDGAASFGLSASNGLEGTTG